MELRSRPGRRRRGSFLILLVAVLVALVHLDLEAGAWWERALIRDAEEQLSLDLVRLQRAVDLYRRRQGRLPRELDEVLRIRPRILARIPLDPTIRERTWTLRQGEISSRSAGIALDGTRYADWRARRAGSTWVVVHREEAP